MSREKIEVPEVDFRRVRGAQSVSAAASFWDVWGMISNPTRGPLEKIATALLQHEDTIEEYRFNVQDAVELVAYVARLEATLARIREALGPLLEEVEG